MKKGHRRTQSATICINRPIEKERNSKPIYNQQKNIPFLETPMQSINTFDIQTLLKNSQAKIHERVFLIDNLQKPVINNDQCAHFQFGKRNHLKLKPQNPYQALNMIQIPQQAKSKQSPSIQNDDKISIEDKQTFFTQKPLIQEKYSKMDKINELKNYGIKGYQHNKDIIGAGIHQNHNEKNIKSRHTYTKSTKILSFKNTSNMIAQKQTTQAHVYNHQNGSNNKVNMIGNKKIMIGIRQEYQTHKKNALSYNFKPASQINQKQTYMQAFGLLKRKKKNFVI